MKLKKFQEASESFTKAMNFKPDRPDIVFHLAKAYLELGKLGRARMYFEKVLEKKNHHADAYN